MSAALRLRSLRPTVLSEDAAHRVVHVAWHPTKGAAADLERGVWAATHKARADDGRGAVLLESSVYRGPASATFRPGDFLASLGLTEAAWDAWKSGTLTARDLLKIATNPGAALQPERKKNTMKKSFAKAFVAAGIATPAAGAAVIKSFENALARARKAFDKDPSPTNRALLAEAGRRSLGAKLVASEKSRSDSLQAVRRSQMGLGNPLFKNTNPTPFDIADDADVDGR